MSLATLIKRIENILRGDAGLNGKTQRLEQLTWLLFLKIHDAQEYRWEYSVEGYTKLLPEELQWENWAERSKDENDKFTGEELTGDELIEFVETKLFPALKNLELHEDSPMQHKIVKSMFAGLYNYMKDGVLMRQLLTLMEELDLLDSNERHQFNDVFEMMLKDMDKQSGEFYTPRPLTDTIIKCLDPEIGESVADFACGTGGFLISALKHLMYKNPEEYEDGTSNIDWSKNMDTIGSSLHGVEKKPLPQLLCITNLLLNDVENPNIVCGNSLEKDVKDYTEKDKYDVIPMNPPYGGIEQDYIQKNFPKSMQTSETANLFLTSIMYRLEENGRAGVVLPDGLLFSDEAAVINIKKKLLEDFNLHTILRMPEGIFAPYTNITSNVLFFDKKGTTTKIDYYDIDVPNGDRAFTKTKPVKNEHFADFIQWFKSDRSEENINHYSVTLDELKENKYNMDIKNPKKIVEEKEYTLDELMNINSDIISTISSLNEQLKVLLEE